MLASGSPAGIINTGGTTATFGGTNVVSQQQPSNTSYSVGGALNANCGGGQLGTYIAGQQAIGLDSVGNCDSIIISTLLNKKAGAGSVKRSREPEKGYISILG